MVGLDGQPVPFDFLRIKTSSQHSERGTVLSDLGESTYTEQNAGIYKFQYQLKNPSASVWAAIERGKRQSMQLIRPGLHEYYFRFEERSGEGRQAPLDEPVPREQADGIASYRYDSDTGVPSADIGIITMKIEEFRAVLKRFVSDDRAIDGQNLRYNFRKFADNDGNELTVAIVRSRQGDVNALYTAMELIREVRPRLVVLVGIAGGRPAGEFTLGDVVVASKMINLTVDAANPDGSRGYATSASELHPDVEKVVLNLEGMRAAKIAPLNRPLVRRICMRPHSKRPPSWCKYRARGISHSQGQDAIGGCTLRVSTATIEPLHRVVRMKGDG
ncbi:hypothetical protein HAP47_0007370 [Bradyrhizobium sp. 41S5]|uniref:phosphorylase family protein n=1 Tax=Bradyrhizobium sp. 41S5 TaxID=1404443 RepID=UPI00156BD967|nr:hypothetical protein [Bradyrhizobium sp. 41S5]UFX46495.1 hypothetical protein HAP47_0007370 [Bradyrhizobium sp. 41S5]